MFIEAALEVSHDNGVVEFIVPNSITFRGHEPWKVVRRRCEASARKIATRTYNNVPKPVFPRLPWVKTTRADNTKNLQRVTVITIVRRPAAPTTPTTRTGSGLIRIGRESRERTLKAICPGVQQPNLDEQWTEVPTQELVELFMLMHGPKIQRQNGTEVTFPGAPGYFISFLPVWTLEDSGRPTIAIPNETYWLWMGLYNSHLFHAYWLMIGDYFHVTQNNIATVQSPTGWHEEKLRARIEDTARTLLSDKVVDQCRVQDSHRGVRHNVNFHLEGTDGPALIEALDRLLLHAYGLPEDPTDGPNAAHPYRQRTQTVAQSVNQRPRNSTDPSRDFRELRTDGA